MYGSVDKVDLAFVLFFRLFFFTGLLHSWNQQTVMNTIRHVHRVRQEEHKQNHQLMWLSVIY